MSDNKDRQGVALSDEEVRDALQEAGFAVGGGTSPDVWIPAMEVDELDGLNKVRKLVAILSRASSSRAEVESAPVAWQRRVMEGDKPLSGWIHCDEWDVETQRQHGNEVRALGVIAATEPASAKPESYCRVCDGTGTVSTGIAEASNTQCRVCDGTGLAAAEAPNKD